MNIYGFYIFLYFALSLVFTIHLAINDRSNHRVINFIIVYWYLAFNLYQSRIVLGSVPYVHYLRKADELLGYFFLMLYIMLYIAGKAKDNKLIKPQKIKYEVYLIMYLLLSILLYGLHNELGNIGGKRAFIFSRLALSAILIYFGVKRFMTRDLLRGIFKATIFMGIISSFLSFIQFFIDTKVFRTGAFHNAFMSYHRSSGIFLQPYDNGLFLIFAVYTVIYTVKEKKYKIILVMFFLLGMILTFTRGIWISFIFVSIFHMYYYFRNTFKRYIFVFATIIFLTILTLGTYILQSDVFTNKAFQDRVFADTITIRMVFYGFIIKAIPDAWAIGYGDVINNDVYFQGMVDSDQGLYWALGRQGSIHNMFLEVAFLQGIFAMIIFTMTFIYFFRFNFNESIKNRSFAYCLPNYYVMGFFFYFFSVAGFLLSRSGFLSIFMFAIIGGIKSNNLDLNGITVSFKMDEFENIPILESDENNFKNSSKDSELSISEN